MYHVWDFLKTLDVFKGRLDIVEEKISKFEDKTRETIQNEIQKGEILQTKYQWAVGQFPAF